MLFSYLVLFISAEGLDGGWNTIPVDHESVKRVKEYLDTNIPHLFPEYENGKYNIESARLQVVSGENLELTINSSTTPLVFTITLYLSLQNTIQLKEISRPVGSRPLLGGYMWQNPAHFTSSDLDHLATIIRSHIDLLIQSEGRVLVYRTQNAKGLRTHVIYQDERNTICSAVVFKNFVNNTEEFISAYQIF